MKQKPYFAAFILFTFWIGGISMASDPDIAGMKKIFQAMEKGILDKNEKLFRSVWHPQAYKENLVGGSGMPGFKVYDQGVRKKWTIRPDFNKMIQQERNGLFFIPCEIYLWEKNKVVDHVWALPVYDSGLKTWLILGIGEENQQLSELAKRYQNKKPLKPN